MSRFFMNGTLAKFVTFEIFNAHIVKLILSMLRQLSKQWFSYKYFQNSFGEESRTIIWDAVEK